MPDPVEQLAARVLAAAPADRPAALRDLARAADPATALAALAPGGPRLGLDFVARLPEPLPAGVVRPAVRLLADTIVPIGLRLVAAGKVLGGADAVLTNAVVQPLVAGLTDDQHLDRLLDLRRLTDRCEPLDRLVAAAEAASVRSCPVCRATFTRPGLTAHLWQVHRVPAAAGRPLDPRVVAEAALTEAAGDPFGAATDRAYLLSRHLFPEAAPGLVFQALARGSPDPTQADRLLERAKEANCGVCPVCLAAVPDPLPPLPPPADVSHGRVAADGFVAAVDDKPTGRVVTLLTPAGDREPPDEPRLPPRLAAVLFALPVFAVGLLVTLVLPGRAVHPLAVAGLAAAAGWLTYVFVQSSRAPLGDPTDAAVELAWRHLVPGIGRSPAAVRFLTRLCRGSLGHGDPGPRAGAVHELAEQAAVLDRKGEAYSQLAAAAAVLRAGDAARIGKEPVAALVEVFRPFAGGRASAGFAEAAAEIVLADLGLPAGDVARLGVGVTAVLFDAGLTPPDVTLVARFCPWLKKLLPAAADSDHLAGLFAVWQMAASRAWGAVGPATTIFDLATNSPLTGRRLLAAHPDALLRLDIGDAATDAVGAVVLTSRGLAVGGLLADDPDERLEAVKTPAGWRLLVGRGQLAAEAPIPAKLPDLLRGWLIWRAGRLLPRADEALGRRPKRAAEMLIAVAGDCPLCGTRCGWRAGRLGTPWQAVTGA